MADGAYHQNKSSNAYIGTEAAPEKDLPSKTIFSVRNIFIGSVCLVVLCVLIVATAMNYNPDTDPLPKPDTDHGQDQQLPPEPDPIPENTPRAHNDDNIAGSGNVSEEENETTAASEHTKEEVEEWLRSEFGSKTDFNKLVPPKKGKVFTSPNVEILEDDTPPAATTKKTKAENSDQNISVPEEVELSGDDDEEVKVFLEQLARESAERKLNAAGKLETSYSLEMEDID